MTWKRFTKTGCVVIEHSASLLGGCVSICNDLPAPACRSIFGIYLAFLLDREKRQTFKNVISALIIAYVYHNGRLFLSFSATSVSVGNTKKTSFC